MSGLTPLVDTLLATRLAQRVDLVPLKAQGEVAGPGSIAPVEEVTNDVRLPSKAAFQSQLAIDLHDGRSRGPIAAPPNVAARVTLSAVAQAVSAVLESDSGQASFIRGAQALCAPAQVPQTQLLAATLAHVVASSGLFYESHLKQYAAGTRTLAQMIQEPQALLGGGVQSSPNILEATSADPLAIQPGVATAGRIGTAQGSDLSQPMNMLPVRMAPDLDAEAGHGARLGLAGTGPAPAGLAASLDIANFSAIYKATGESSIATLAAAAAGRGEELVVDLPRSPLFAVNSLGSAPVLIHPDAVALVRQQLELLDSPVFKWRGEAWPGAQMEWEIAENGSHDESAAHGQAKLHKWATQLNVQMPTLGMVQVRLDLEGSVLSAAVNVLEQAAAATLKRSADALNQQLSVHGLQLQVLEINQSNQINQI